MIRLAPLISKNEASATPHGSLAGDKSVRRKTISDDLLRKLVAPGKPFHKAAVRFTINEKEANGLYRMANPRYNADRSVEEQEIIIPKRFERTSKDADNIYTVLMSRLPSWKGWPRRSFSMIFFCGLPPKTEAEHYGSQLYKVLPHNNAKIVVSPIHDLLDDSAFPHMIKMIDSPNIGDVQQFGSFLRRVIGYARLADEMLSLPDGVTSDQLRDLHYSHISSKTIETKISYAEYDKMIKSLTELLSKDKEERIFNAIDSLPSPSFRASDKNNVVKMLSLVKDFGGWEEYFDELFDPKKNGFQLMNVDNIRNITKHDVLECWTEDPCILQKSDIELS